ncbi:phenylalanine--tRNA ligase subunit alpha [Patescibacteria group bacterium]|nr:phenylalanine--tRNA ligase subunit alpha [Patescibacteria group bacterium]MBU1890181.1 phenylalanine--tRNA ligase subunit alpha [Patescibacteria group bacterium]
MIERLKNIKEEVLDKIDQATSVDGLNGLRVRYLGRKSELMVLLRKVKSLPEEQRKEAGKLGNDIRKNIEDLINEKVRSLAVGVRDHVIDETLPGKKIQAGKHHPLTLFIRKIKDIFDGMGFEVIDGMEVEIAKYNFDLLNIPRDHPARDHWDTYYVTGGRSTAKTKEPGEQLLLRTHTSPVQLRSMLQRKPPVRLIAPGRTFRHEATDASHESQFYQCEGLVIDEGIKVTDLIGTLKEFLKNIFNEEIKIRVRPEYYPFVEPGMDIDIMCVLCGGKGCSVCSQRGWLEMLGSGMVHPTVLKNMNVDPKKYSGFAFGLGIDRLMMFYYGVKDVRLSYSGDLRFVNQF